MYLGSTREGFTLEKVSDYPAIFMSAKIVISLTMKVPSLLSMATK